MDNFINKLKPYLSTSFALSAAIIISIQLIRHNPFVPGMYLLSAWLLMPLLMYWLVGDHKSSISFLVKPYPVQLRLFVSYSCVALLSVASILWIYIIIDVKFR